MKWKAPSDRTQLILLSPIIAPLFVLFVPVYFSFQAWERWGPEAKWRPWFAWRPVKIWLDPADLQSARWVWLERIEKFSGVYANTDYRATLSTHQEQSNG